MKRLVIPLAALALTLSLVRCGGPGEDPKPDASGITTGKDASQAKTDGGGEDRTDGSTTQPGNDASSTQPGEDASTTQPGEDASTTQPGEDASTTQPGADASLPGPCNPFDQTGCTVNGQKCTLDQTGAIVCGPAGAKTDQQDCIEDSECAAGLTCVGVQGETGNKCRAFCNPPAKLCPAGQVCAVGAPGAAEPFLCLAVAACDPFAQTGCTNPQKCTLIDPAGPVWTCGPAGTKDNQETCANDGECKAGLACLDFPSFGGAKCRALCSAAKTCPTDETCLGRFESDQDPFICLPTPSCDPLLQNCTSATDGCFPATPTSWSCFPAGTLTGGQACVNANDCIEGYLCASTSSGNVCVQICNPAAGGVPACTTGTCHAQGTIGLCG